jgi:hypothetical protein
VYFCILVSSFFEISHTALSLMFSTIHIFAFDYDAMCATHPDFSGIASSMDFDMID